MDGSNLWQRMWHVTLPTIRPIMLLMLVLQIIATMQVFTEPFVITDGGPNNETMTVLLLIYNYAFKNADFGEPSALGVLLFLVLAVFALIYMRMTSRLMQGDSDMALFTQNAQSSASRQKQRPRQRVEESSERTLVSSLMLTRPRVRVIYSTVVALLLV